ncbi:CoA pyrophosphatase [uncultured Propionivibrio sp.]|uniref:CoA pyrophosphatase n=1 Tax=uncultured Propionivibrio sp. TaxID=426737 RepID=UPI0029C03203|nr:CoA pyrophosphatase [uncultured Propionivibrio sp.]
MTCELALTAESDVGAAAGQLRRALLSAPLACELHVGDDGSSPESLTPASVLFPIVRRDAGWFVLLTQRTDHLRDHPGQISFPGGRVEPEDLSPVHTALRETQEEIGLSSEHIEVIGFLPDYCTITGYRVTPVVALVTPPFDLSPDAHEVAQVFEVPFDFLMDPANHQEHVIQRNGRPRKFYAVPYQDYFIWGATAGIILSLHRALTA